MDETIKTFRKFNQLAKQLNALSKERIDANNKSQLEEIEHEMQKLRDSIPEQQLLTMLMMMTLGDDVKKLIRGGNV